MHSAMTAIMQGQANDAQIAALMVALSMKGESADELAGAVQAMRDLMLTVPLDAAIQAKAVDIVGTGGDGAQLFNVSTASAIVAASAGAIVAKHGNRSVSSKSGSADVLEAAGLQLKLSSQQVASCITNLGLGFMFAPQHHPAMRYAASARAALGLRSFFNVLGPMTNPAGVRRHLLGVYNAALAPKMAEVLMQLGSERILLVHGHGQLDELSLTGPNQAWWADSGDLQPLTITPEDAGLTTQPIDCLKVENAEQSYQLLLDALGKQRTAAGKVAAHMVALNAGAALWVAGQTSNLRHGVQLAEDAIYGGRAREKLGVLVEYSHSFE
jgi:anthranilate phosphoribosyltransferase